MPSWGGAQNVRDQIGYQQQRYENQQGPMADLMGYNYARGSEADYGNYTDIMNNYRDIYSGGGDASGGGGGGGGGFSAEGMYTPFTVGAERVGYSDPFKSYGGFEEFSNTGGYSRNDIANMRARATSPIRAAYGNAEREMGRQRSLQGGYSPNAFAAQGRMAREQSQGMADAAQNVEAGLAQARNQGRLSGLTGMSGIEGQRLDAQLKAGMFNSEQGLKAGMYNADAQSQAQARNIGAAESAAGRSAAASAASMSNRFRALEGAQNMYGTTPGMTNMFGQQVGNMIGQGGNMGMGYINATGKAEEMPGNWDIATGRIGQVADAVYPWLGDWAKGQQNGGGGGQQQTNNSTMESDDGGYSRGAPQAKKPASQSWWGR